MRIWSLQVLRFWAALGVVAYHAYADIYQTTHQFGLLGENWARMGRSGVDLFFVLSGVIIASTSRGLTAGEFIARRARRIVPLYAMMTAFFMGARALAGTLGWREIVTSVTLWPALDRMVKPVMAISWTLCFEVLFYASAALVLWRPRLIWLVLTALAAALVVRSGPVLKFVGNPIVLEFGLGIALTRLPKWRGAVWLIPLGVAATWAFGVNGYSASFNVLDFLSGNGGWSRLLYLGVPAAMVVWGAMQIEARQGVLTYLGDASYALYMVHLPVVMLVAWMLGRFTAAAPDLIVLTAATASIAVAWRVHELFEKPVLDRLGRPVLVASPA